MARLAEWAGPGAAPPLRLPPGGGRPAALARNGLGHIVRSAHILLGGEEPTGRGLLESFDARAKVAGLLSVLVAATQAERPEAIAGVLAASWIVALASGLDMRRFLLGVSVVPLFTLAIALPAALNAVTPGEPVVVLLRYPAGSFGPWRWPEDLAVTAPGLLVALRFVLRSTACVSLAALITASTATPDLLRGLRGLGVPPSFVMTAGMMVRYLSLLLRGAEEVHMAKLSRSLAGVGTARERAWAAASLAEIFGRSRRLAEAVTRAMVSRGYAGEARVFRRGSLRARDGLLLAICAAAAALLFLKG